jgi:hypothetical protein
VLELCKDRVGLLLPQKRGPQLWHAPEVKLLGLPPSNTTTATAKAKNVEGGKEEGKQSPPSPPPPPPFPFTEEQLLRACRCAPGAPVSTADIERDCVSLQATGLFRSVRPSTSLPPANAAPQFVRGLVDALKGRKSGAAMTGGGEKGQMGASSETRMQPVLPLGEIRFKATLRELPALASVTWRLSSALEEMEGFVSVDKRKADAACAVCLADAEARAAAAGGSGTAAALALAAAAPLFRAAVKGLGSGSGSGSDFNVSVQYEGVGGPSVEAVLRPGPPRSVRGAPETGLESSAEQGRGAGVEPFVPYRGPLALTKTMRVENLADVLELELESVDDVSPADGCGRRGGIGSSSGGGGGFVSRWPKVEAKRKEGEGEKDEKDDDDNDDEEEEEAKEEAEEPKSLFDPLVEATATWLTKEYGRHQSAAAAAAGVADGDGWRKALETAAASSSSTSSTSSSSSSSSSTSDLAAVQVLLGDAPASRTSKQLAAGVLKAFPFSLGTAVASVAAAVAVLTGRVDLSSLPFVDAASTPPETQAAAAVVAASALASLAAFWPLVGPLIRIERFSKLSAERIEGEVAPGEPLSTTTRTRFGGEDALMSWPGAHRAVVEERDAFMAASIFAAAKGESFVPAFVLDQDADGRGVWRYAMPLGEVYLNASNSSSSTSSSTSSTSSTKLPSRVLPKRGGEGVYAPVPAPRAVVAVVGTAHAAGIRKAWSRLVEEEEKKKRKAREVAAAALEGEILV